MIELLAPGCSTLYPQSCSLQDWEELLTARFNSRAESASLILTDSNYHIYSSNITTLTLCLEHMEKSLSLRRHISSRLVNHHLTSYLEFNKFLNNLQQLSDALQSTRSRVQHRFWQMLDLDTGASAAKLRGIMSNVSLLYTLWLCFTYPESSIGPFEELECIGRQKCLLETFFQSRSFTLVGRWAHQLFRWKMVLSINRIGFELILSSQIPIRIRRLLYRCWSQQGGLWLTI